jgi:hypothetical protein
LGSSFLETLIEGIEVERQEQLKEEKDYKRDQKNIKMFMKYNDNSKKENSNEQEGINLIEEI